MIGPIATRIRALPFKTQPLLKHLKPPTDDDEEDETPSRADGMAEIFEALKQAGKKSGVIDVPDEDEPTPLEPREPLEQLLELLINKDEAVTPDAAMAALRGATDIEGVTDSDRVMALSLLVAGDWLSIPTAVGTPATYDFEAELEQGPGWVDYPSELSGEQTRQHLARQFAFQLFQEPTT